MVDNLDHGFVYTRWWMLGSWGQPKLFLYITTCMIGMCISLYQVLPCALTLIIWLPVCVSGKKAPDVMSIQHKQHTHFLLQSGYYYQVLQSKNVPTIWYWASVTGQHYTLFPQVLNVIRVYWETNSTLFACLLIVLLQTGVIYHTQAHTLTLTCSYPHTSTHPHTYTVGGVWHL